MIREMIAILDFGSQYGQLIARRVREQNVYSRICRAGTPAEELAKMPLKGIILSGGPASVYQPNAPRCDERIFDLGVPILGICYGMQLGCQILGGKVIPAKSREYGRATLAIRDKSDLLRHAARRDPDLGQPRRPGRQPGQRLRHAGFDEDLPLRRGPPPHEEVLRRPVPPRGHPHAQGARSF